MHALVADLLVAVAPSLRSSLQTAPGLLVCYALLIENKGSGMSLIQELQREGIRAIEVKPEGDKVMRMNAHTAKIEAGYVHIPRRASWLDEFRKEIMAFPVGKYDDQVDALSQALDRAFSNRNFMYCGPLKGLY